MTSTLKSESSENIFLDSLHIFPFSLRTSHFNTSFAKENKEGVDYNKKINEKFLFILQCQPPLALHELHEAQTPCSRFYTH